MFTQRYLPDPCSTRNDIQPLPPYVFTAAAAEIASVQVSNLDLLLAATLRLEATFSDGVCDSYISDSFNGVCDSGGSEGSIVACASENSNNNNNNTINSNCINMKIKNNINCNKINDKDDYDDEDDYAKDDEIPMDPRLVKNRRRTYLRLLKRCRRDNDNGNDDDAAAAMPRGSVPPNSPAEVIVDPVAACTTTAIAARTIASRVKRIRRERDLEEGWMLAEGLSIRLNQLVMERMVVDGC